MKKPYILFAVILVVLILAFTVSRSYLESLEKDAKGTTAKGVQKSDLDQFKLNVEKRIDESESDLLARLDGLERQFRESQISDTVAARPAVPIARSVVQTPAKSPDSELSVSTSQQAPDISEAAANAPSESENEIYMTYLKRRWALPSDLTVAELKLAKDELMQDVGRQYTMSAEEVLQLIDRVYAYRQAKKQR